MAMIMIMMMIIGEGDNVVCITWGGPKTDTVFPGHWSYSPRRCWLLMEEKVKERKRAWERERDVRKTEFMILPAHLLCKQWCDVLFGIWTLQGQTVLYLYNTCHPAFYHSFRGDHKLDQHSHNIHTHRYTSHLKTYNPIVLLIITIIFFMHRG